MYLTDRNPVLPLQNFCFVAGVHRSGTSLVARLLSDHPEVRAITAAPVPENEGCYLQGAIPHTAQDGVPVHFATDPRQHHTEDSRFNSLEVRDRLRSDWQPWFEPGGRWRVEKSPVNLTRMRLYQQLFPLSHFIVVLRHPETVAAATQKWRPDIAEAARIDYWVNAHEQVLADLSYLHAVMVLRYEAIISDPEVAVEALHRFLGLEPVAAAEGIFDGNQKYQSAPIMHREQAEKAAKWGYGPGQVVETAPPFVRHPLRQRREQVEQVLAQANQ